MSEKGPGCVKTCTRSERAELFSLFSSSDGDWQIASFLIQRNRDKLSTRKFDVGVFTQPGPTTDLCTRKDVVHIHEQANQGRKSLYRRPKESSVSTPHVRSMPVARSLMLVLRRPDGAAHIPAAWIIRPISRNAALANTHLYASPFASFRPTRARPKGICSQKLA